MSCLQVIAPGLFTTVQDLGRPGYAHLGVSVSGAADALALRLGNRLVGNGDNYAALEMTMTGASFRFPEGATFALAGSDSAGELDGKRISTWRTIAAVPGSCLRLGPTGPGARCYLCVRGGIRVPLLLGSASTHFLSGLGGVQGRAIRAGDLLRIGREPFASPNTAIRQKALVRLERRLILRVTSGVQADRFSEGALHLFYNSEYTVTEQANRMGLRLQGPDLRTIDGAGILSQGVSCGCIQVTNAGQPLILFMEQQTTGGYPLIAAVISVDLPSVGQLRPGDTVRFQPTTFLEAATLWRQQELWIASGDMFE